MRTIAAMTLGLVLVTAFAGMVWAQAPSTQPSGQTGYPSVSNLKPFSAEANFMSLPGYLRYLTHQQTGQWLTYAEAARVVSQQHGQ